MGNLVKITEREKAELKRRLYELEDALHKSKEHLSNVMSRYRLLAVRLGEALDKEGEDENPD